MYGGFPMPTSKIRAAILIIAASTTATPLLAANDAAQLQFSDLGGVRAWRVGGDTVIFIKSKTDEWYRADMKETCMKYDTKKGINFITELDPETNQKVSAVVVERRICRITSLQKVDATAVPQK